MFFYLIIKIISNVTFEFNQLPKDFFFTLLLNCMALFAFCSSNYFIFIYSQHFRFEILKI